MVKKNSEKLQPARSHYPPFDQLGPGRENDFMVLYDHLHHNNFMGIVLG